ncbi:MFS transporter [Candidatus Chloroploca sp. M-50]|uniref:MFS transporter n=1 Tax=Candidatus Chloroploca mongolica TaxID=2528176 RepID=A0ABS4DG78_9CHLR|nr:MFS transporter [Candidatus Chloroploca mongolica]MBP1468443.1 MFS transporter [Candidatus Chloroploca mongolica]
MAEQATPPASVVAVHERLPLKTRLAFGAGDVSPGMAAIIVGFFQALFLTTVAGLNPGAVGLILLLSRVWDAITDPWMGLISDRTRSRFGRRRFWMLVGAVPFGLIYMLLWWVPPLGETGRFFYYLVVILAFNTAYTIVNVPYTSLTAELTSDYDERTALNSFRFAFSIGGSLIAGVLHGILITRFCLDPNRCLPAEAQAGYFLSAVIFGVVMIWPFLWCVFGTRERYTPPATTMTMPLRQQFQIALRNQPFLFVIGVYLCSWMALQITQNVIGFYLTFYLRRADMFPIVLLAVQGSAMIFLFVWSAVSRRIGKQKVYYIGMCFWIAVMSGLFFVGPDQITLAIVLAALAGVGIATAYLVPWSMLPDVVDLDELNTGQRREGIFYGVMTFTQKTAVGVGIALTLQALQWYGFNRDLLPGEQPESALLALRWMIGPVPTVLLIIGMILVYRYPLTRERHEAILTQLAERKG